MRMRILCRHTSAILLGVMTLSCSAESSHAIRECARIFESEIRDGVVHGAAVVAGGQGDDTAVGATHRLLAMGVL